MGLLRSIVKFFCFFLRWKLDDDGEEEEESDPTLHRWRQNQHYTPNAERSIPILRVQNPVPTTFISNEPSSKGKEKLKEEVTIVKSRVVDEVRWTNVESSPLVYPWRPRKDPILPVQNPVPKKELKKEVMIVKNRVMVDEGRWIKHYSSRRHRILLVGEGDFSFSASLAVAFGSASNIIATSVNSNDFLKKNYANAASNIKEIRNRGGTVMHGIDATEMANHASLRHLKFDRIVFNFAVFRELTPQSQLRRLVSLFLKNAREMVCEDGEIHITHKTNATLVVTWVNSPVERWIKHYSSSHRILVVGDGDFSFSASLAAVFGCASNMVATSLDSADFLVKNYANAYSNIFILRSLWKCEVLHGIDATQMANHPSFHGRIKFDRIVFNFPFAGFFKNMSRHSQLGLHRRLVSQFLENAKKMVSGNGEIHITHKTNGFHMEWKLESIACDLHGLRLVEAVDFNLDDYPGYNTKRGFGGDDNFNCYPSKTYKFRLGSSY